MNSKSSSGLTYEAVEKARIELFGPDYPTEEISVK